MSADLETREPDRELSVAALHPDWCKGWGRSIEGASLLAAMEANPRLQSRLLASIAETHGRSLPRNPRLDRTTDAVAAALREDRVGFLRLCGLSHIGRRIAMATNPEDFGVLSKAFGAARLAAAARISTELPDEGADHGYDSEQLVPAVERTGRAVMAAWIATLPGEAADWLTMLLPRERGGRGEGGVGVGTARAVAIIEGAAERWRSTTDASDAGRRGRPAIEAPTPTKRRRAA